MPTHLHSFSRLYGKPGGIPKGIWTIALRQARVLSRVHELRHGLEDSIELELSSEWRMSVSSKGDVRLANHESEFVFDEEAGSLLSLPV